MICNKCGKENDNKSKFCQYCGTPLKAVCNSEVMVDSKKTKHSKLERLEIIISVAILAILCCVLYWTIYGWADFKYHTGPISALFAKKCGLNQNLDFGDFSIYFDEEISGVKKYELGNNGYVVKVTDDEKQLCGLAGVISVTNSDYVYLGNIDVSMCYNDSSTIYSPECRAVKTDAGIFDTENISSLTRYESAYIMYGGTHFADERLERAVFYYKDSKGKRHLYYVEP